MPVRRVALIFDDQTRPETTGVYCRRALHGLVEVAQFAPADLERIPRQGFDLYLSIDDGLDYRLPPDLHPCAWWAIDTHLDFTRCLAKARDCEFVFAAQRDGAQRLRDEGVTAHWLPLACDPEIHRKHDVAKEYDVCFVGHVFPGPRAELVDLLQRRFPNTFVGQCYFEEMARTYSAARVVFNRSIRNDLNMRVFEALACGSLLVTNDLSANGQAELFQDGVHLATYRDEEELVDKVRFYLKRAESRERIAAAGRQAVLETDTYRHRMERLLEETERELSTATVRSDRIQAVEPPQDAAGDQADGPGPIHRATTNGSAVGIRDRSYFEHVRPEVLTLIPTSARRVLDIGCGAGRLGEALKARQQAEVVGIEYDPEAARLAERRLDRVLVGDVEELRPDFAPHSFDAVVCGDVLEHLCRPDRLLRRVRRWLRRAGRLVASIPNVRHHSVVCSLLDGNWTYEAAGLLDRDHVRFFTRRAIHALLARTGFRIRTMQVVPGPGYAEWQARGRPGEVRVGRLHIADLPVEDAEEFYVYQYLVTARRAPVADQATPARATPRATGPCRMRFTQDFRRDFEQFDFRGPPFAFARFGDGERAVCAGGTHCDARRLDLRRPAVTLRRRAERGTALSRPGLLPGPVRRLLRPCVARLVPGADHHPAAPGHVRQHLRQRQLSPLSAAGPGRHGDRRQLQRRLPGA